ncbi:binding-protein-dependent transport systems inner membrane component [Parafrankia sp. EAN1pec]|uniref:ABC transporter permease n=1 Tax=Parafrankia sp. (strain EAN1pec) TaxID=298653 RepID=UPI0000541350|nr:binding-protein-dependent transport systems inner membrane component [Frankia sp. EAN1pec]
MSVPTLRIPGRPARSARLGRPRPGVVIAALVLLLFLLAAVWPSLFTGTGPTDGDLLATLQAPGGKHWFGTDQLGRDVFARVVHGTRYSLTIGLAATGIAVVIATVWGLAAALSGRFVDGLLMRTTDVMLALPPLLLALIVVMITGKGVVGVTLAVAVSGVPGFARVIRGQALVVRRSGYVSAAVGLGVRRWRVAARHVLPNTLAPLLVFATVTLGIAIASASALSYLGLGAQPPSPEWGAMLTEGQDYLGQAWWIAVFPGLLLVVVVLAVTVLGRHAQARSEGRVWS